MNDSSAPGGRQWIYEDISAAAVNDVVDKHERREQLSESGRSPPTRPKDAYQ